MAMTSHHLLSAPANNGRHQLHSADALSGFWQNVSDEDLMEEIKSGNARAFTEIVSRHIGSVVGFAARMAGSRIDGEDIAQEAFLRIWLYSKRWKPFENRQGGSFRAWLYRIVINLVIDRKRQRIMVSIDGLIEFADDSPDSFSQLYWREVTGSISQAVQLLPQRQRTALILCFFEGYSNIEASKIMSVTISAIEALLVRARRTLRAALKDEYHSLLKP